MATAPAPPNPLMLSNVTQTSVGAIFTDNGDGGSPIIESQIGYGINPMTPQSFLTANALVSSIINDLSPGLLYYFWVRSRNAIGWSDWSAVRSVTLVAGAYVRLGPFSGWSRAVPYVNVGGTWKVARAWGRVAGVWRETL